LRATLGSPESPVNEHLSTTPSAAFDATAGRDDLAVGWYGDRAGLIRLARDTGEHRAADP
jgi:hypothetical protein